MSRASRGPFEQHLRDAIELNALRAPRYAALSGGASLVISRRLILAERALLPVAHWFDRRARRWEEAGIPLLESVFVPMSTSPRFGAPGETTAVHGTPPRPSAVRRRIGAAFGAGGFEGAAAAIAAELESMRGNPGADCLVRHLLESAQRLTVLSAEHVRVARERGLPSPAWLLALLLRLHLWGLGAASDLDARARPLQARGIPILANDLPPIPAGREIVTSGK